MVNEKVQKIIQKILKVEKLIPALKNELEKVAVEEERLTQAKLLGENYSEASLSKAEEKHRSLKKDMEVAEKSIPEFKQRLCEAINEEKEATLARLSEVNAEIAHYRENLTGEFYKAILEVQVLFNLFTGMETFELAECAGIHLPASGNFTRTSLIKDIAEEVKKRSANTIISKRQKLNAYLQSMSFGRSIEAMAEDIINDERLKQANTANN